MKLSDRGRDGKDEARKAAMALLAQAPGQQLQQLWEDAAIAVEAELLRGPETGLVTVRGRIGGGGAPFNVGEATVTRATVRLASGEVGHSYALGRDGQKARLAAIIDALGQNATHASQIDASILAPLREARRTEDERKRAETAATKVDFFTMVRGED